MTDIHYHEKKSSNLSAYRAYRSEGSIEGDGDYRKINIYIMTIYNSEINHNRQFPSKTFRGLVQFFELSQFDSPFP